MLVALAGGIWFAVTGRWVTALICLAGAALGGLSLLGAFRRFETTEWSGVDRRPLGVLILLGAAVVAAGSTVFLLHADGSVTAYFVGGVVLALALYMIGATLWTWRRTFSPAARSARRE